MTAHIQRIISYPIKGFPGIALPHAELHCGQGLPDDRRFAVLNGSLPQPPQFGNNWVPCENFVRLTVNPDIVLYRTLPQPLQGIGLQTPDGESASLTADCPLQQARFDDLLARCFDAGAHGPVRLAERSNRLGYWDVEDAPLSLINLASISDSGTR
jgi:hypothetical protein